MLHPREHMPSIMAPPEAGPWSPPGHGPPGGNRKRDAPMDGFQMQEPKRGPAAPAGHNMYALPPPPIPPSPSRQQKRQRQTGGANTAKDQPGQAARSRGRPPRKEPVKTSYPKIEPRPSPNPSIALARVNSGGPFGVEGIHDINSQSPTARPPMRQHPQPPPPPHPAEPSPRLPPPYPAEYAISNTQMGPSTYGSSGATHGSSASTHGSSASQVGIPRGGQAHEAATDARVSVSYATLAGNKDCGQLMLTAPLTAHARQ
jgi:hypothetical protein